MIDVKLGAKAKSYDFNVSDIDLTTIDTHPQRTTISQDGSISLYSDDNSYVTLEGKFKLLKMGDPEEGIKRLDAITVVENGKVSYTASGLDMTGGDFASGNIFKAYIAAQTFAINGNNFANDIVSAGHNDVLRGAGGNDILAGMAGNDKLFGDAGADILSGGLGDDVLVGGKGADVFVFIAGDGNDIIKDFNTHGNAHDVIDLSGHDGMESYQDLDISQSGSHLIIDFGADGSIVLKNMSIEDLGQEDFLL